MVSMLEVAGEGRMLWVFEVVVRPAVRYVWSEVGAPDGLRDRRGRGQGRRGDRAGCSMSAGGSDSVGAMVTGTGGGGGEAAILIGGTEVEHEVADGFGRLRSSAPVATGNFEESGGLDKVVAETDN